MPNVRMSARGVGNLRPRPGRTRDYFFDKTPGVPALFGVRVSAEGSRVYVVGYRAGRRRRWLTLGDVAVLGLAQARGLAREKLLAVANGEDPATKRDEERRADSLSALVEEYIGREERAAGTDANYRRQNRALGRTPLGKTPAPAVTRADIRAYLEALAEAAPVQANRMWALIRATCRWAVGRDLLPLDPTTGVERPTTEAPERTRLEDDQVRRLWESLDSGKEADTLTPEVIACVRALLFLGTRKIETCRMRWANLDLEANLPTWTIPAADRKGGRALVVPLPPVVVDIIKSLHARTGDHQFVFSGKRGGPLSSNPSRWADAVRRACGITFSPHALRRTFARGVARLGVQSEMISRLLGHKLAAGAMAVTEGYSEYDFLPERASALRAWSEHVLAVVSGERKSNVLPMARA